MSSGKDGGNRRATGARYEDFAADYLKDQGFAILARNFRCAQGEIDLVAREQEYLVFLEVKYRRDGRMGTAAEAVSPSKQRRIARCAQYYLHCHREYQGMPCRFDVVTVQGDEVALIRDAFWCQER